MCQYTWLFYSYCTFIYVYIIIYICMYVIKIMYHYYFTTIQFPAYSHHFILIHAYTHIYIHIYICIYIYNSIYLPMNIIQCTLLLTSTSPSPPIVPQMGRAGLYIRLRIHIYTHKQYLLKFQIDIDRYTDLRYEYYYIVIEIDREKKYRYRYSIYADIYKAFVYLQARTVSISIILSIALIKS